MTELLPANDSPTPLDMAMRSEGVGASETPTLFGCGYLQEGETHLQDLVKLYRVKIGEADGFQGNKYTRLGSRLENGVAEHHAKENGWTLERRPTARHATHKWLLASIDRVIKEENAILEIKTSASWECKKWKKEPPAKWLIQIAQQMAVGDFEKAYIGGLLQGSAVLLGPFHRNLDLELRIIDAVGEFWQLVESRTVPTQEFLDKHAAF